MTLRQVSTKLHALVALGANLPANGQEPAETLQNALVALQAAGTKVVAQSRFYRTPCFPVGAGPDYVNAAALLEPPLGMEPAALLAVLHEIEARHGRLRETRWAGRTLDLDLIAWGDSVLPDEATQTQWRNLPPNRQALEAPAELILPHPRLQDRAFVLVPLADVAAEWVHPQLGLSVTAMLAALPAVEVAAVKPL